MTDLQKHLFSLADPTYRAFQIRLMPTVDPETVIGVRTPALRAYAKEIAGTTAAQTFLADLPHRFYEENNLHAFLIERMGDYQETVNALNRFLPYVNNWATCDSLSPKCFRRNHAGLRREIDQWLASRHPYAQRFAVKTLMSEFLGSDFSSSDPARLAAIVTDEYYLQMVIAWYFATALAKRYEEIIPYFRAGRLDPQIRAMALRKARESYRISEAQKRELQRIADDREEPTYTCLSLPDGREIPIPEQTVLSLGNFDGVHRGHQSLIRTAREERDRNHRGAACGVFCFRELSSDLLCKNPPEHLTTAAERLAYFAESGAEFAILADFAEIRDLSPEAFAKTVLKERCRCVAAVCGFNYRFGKNAAGTAETLAAMLDAPVTVCEAVKEGGEVVSATRIRNALKAGNVGEAARMLGRPYTLRAEVRHGKELGRKLGFPTVNQNFPHGAVIPKFGVYATDCTVNGKLYRGVSNVGVHPTVDAPEAPANCETYLVGYQGDLYGKTVSVAFLAFLRPEQTFPSVEALREQIASDAKRATEI